MIGWLMPRVMAGVFVVCFSATINAQHEGHKMPAPKPTPRAKPAPTPKREPRMPTPSSTAKPEDSPSPTHTHTPQAETSPAIDANAVDDSAAMEMGPLLMMHGDDMFIRVGTSSVNLIPMGRLGSGTSWQP
ncbi:MAG TPA: hypothetical protein VF074_00515, partial [Pyrinomonadaceae bacterium]